MLLYTDDGAFAGDAAAYGSSLVREGAGVLDVRALRPEELSGLKRPSLGLDFLSGCPLAASK
jgi:hypothetical protein